MYVCTYVCVYICIIIICVYVHAYIVNPWLFKCRQKINKVICIRNGKDNSKRPFEYDDVKGEDNSIQGSPTQISYAATTRAHGENTQSGPALQYDYARTGAIMVRKHWLYSITYVHTCMHGCMYVRTYV